MTHIKKERVVIPMMIQGYPRKLASYWFELIQEDALAHENEFEPGLLTYWHKHGYLSSSVRRWHLNSEKKANHISDFGYICLFPFNNSFEKWVSEILTTQRVMPHSAIQIPKIYFSIIQREDSHLILKNGHEDRCYTEKDILDLVEKAGAVELRPARWNSMAQRYVFTSTGCAHHKQWSSIGEVIESNYKSVKRLIEKLDCSYVIAEMEPERCDLTGDGSDHALKFWISNDVSNKPVILSAEISILPYGKSYMNNDMNSFPVDEITGTFEYKGTVLKIPEWEKIKKDLCKDASDIPQVSYFSATVSVNQDGTHTYLGFSAYPNLPAGRFGKKFDNYLKNKLKVRFQRRTPAKELAAIWNKLCAKGKSVVGRDGIRPYMYDLWLEAAWQDLLHTKGVPLSKKLWSHKHGFFSWRIEQYGLTKNNYRQFLSDYDYYWLNRINNEYQRWVNDKTTFRYIMEPFKEFIPRYYFSVFKREKETIISKMWDCPENVRDGFEGVLEMLKVEGRLAFKASGGTHGDGFYCLSYENGTVLSNGAPCGEDGLRILIENTKSFYVVTEYIEMHKELKKIYDKSVNTVRVMVVNDHGYDPRILQTYMRIGSSRTGYTDNVGYGGICAFVDKDTGELYQPESIVNHKYIPCPVHPDTGIPVSGIVPNWEFTKDKLLDICRYLCELEYLGFDVAITDDGFRILEINIHQDLHKVATFDDEIKEFFNRKIEYKKKRVERGNYSME